MVLEKRSECRFIGNHPPIVPRASRSPRGKSFLKKKVADNAMCAFELLATVAGNLLQESNCSPSSSNVCAQKVQSTMIRDSSKQDLQVNEKPLKVEHYDQRQHEEFSLFNGQSSRNCENSSKGLHHSQTQRSVIKFEKLPRKIEGRREFGFDLNKSVLDKSSREDSIEQLDAKDPRLTNSDSGGKASLYRDCVHDSPYPTCRDDGKVNSTDDDKKNSGCISLKTVKPTSYKTTQLCIRDQRVRKFMGPRYIKEGDRFQNDGDMKFALWRRKTRYTRQRSPRYSPFKRDRFQRSIERNSFLISHRKSTAEGISSPVSNNRNSDSASGVSSSAAGQDSSFQPRDSRVKLSINSFKVPELFIDIPETATVASLKRSVSEAITAILGGGLRIGVLLQGKKLKDDDRTLLDTGICHDNKLDNLGFTLEPYPTGAPSPLCLDDHSLSPTCSTHNQATRHSALPALDPATSNTSLKLQLSNMSNSSESIHNPIPQRNPNSSAMVVMAEALTMEHGDGKYRGTERRIRRPFTVSEVEALVQAVEKLGTGRWRDVKLRAFDNARHRTYVDLKDKWKTLVHTARISPQQRRGLPVPQTLLDRVLSAHAYWSQQQEKHQRETCLLL